MRSGLVVAAAGLWLAAAPAAAADWLADTYVGVGAGFGSAATKEIDVLAELPSTVTAVDIDESGTPWRVFAGKRIGPNLGVELSFVDLGDIDFDVTGTSMNTGAFLTAVAAATPVPPAGVTLDLAGDWTFADFGASGDWAERWYLTGRTGLFAWRSEVSYSDGTNTYRHKDNDVDLHIGVGVGMHLNDRFDLRFDIDGYMATTRMTTTSIGVVYRF